MPRRNYQSVPVVSTSCTATELSVQSINRWCDADTISSISRIPRQVSGKQWIITLFTGDFAVFLRPTMINFLRIRPTCPTSSGSWMNLRQWMWSVKSCVKLGITGMLITLSHSEQLHQISPATLSLALRYPVNVILYKKLSCCREGARASCHWIFRQVTRGYSKWHPWAGWSPY